MQHFLRYTLTYALNVQHFSLKLILIFQAMNAINVMQLLSEICFNSIIFILFN